MWDYHEQAKYGSSFKPWYSFSVRYWLRIRKSKLWWIKSNHSVCYPCPVGSCVHFQASQSKPPFTQAHSWASQNLTGRRQRGYPGSCTRLCPWSSSRQALFHQHSHRPTLSSPFWVQHCLHCFPPSIPLPVLPSAALPVFNAEEFRSAPDLAHHPYPLFCIWQKPLTRRWSLQQNKKPSVSRVTSTENTWEGKGGDYR